ncbi:MAG: enoyl-CoA hydratase/isomerase family protein [Clostridia bacterium]|nr:enoyl-CoA hydratase/isomerase family protein [Clostridia bacterium]
MEYIKLETSGAVVTLTINREKALNALSSQVLSELSEALDSIDLDTARCLIVRGAGTKAFVAGADIGEMSELSEAEALEFARLGTSVFKKIERLPIPSIAAVCGYALGGGCELAMACDIRLVSDTAAFAQPEPGLGIIPGFGGTQRLPLLVGISRAKEILFTGRRVKAQEALQIGLCSGVYPVEELFDKAAEMAAKISSFPKEALRATKEAANASFSANLDNGVTEENKIFARCFAGSEQKECMNAFLSKSSKK